MGLNPLLQIRARDPHNPERWVVHLRQPSLAIDGEPYLEGRLGGEPVELEGRKQANYAVGNPSANLGEAMVLRDISVGNDIDPTGWPIKNPFLVEPGEVNSRNSFGLKVFLRRTPRRLREREAGLMGSLSCSLPSAIDFICPHYGKNY